jgi:hypothetical protein
VAVKRLPVCLRIQESVWSCRRERLVKDVGLVGRRCGFRIFRRLGSTLSCGRPGEPVLQASVAELVDRSDSPQDVMFSGILKESLEAKRCVPVTGKQNERERSWPDHGVHGPMPSPPKSPGRRGR